MVNSSLVTGDAVSQAGHIPAWTPCSAHPVIFDCQECEIGWSPCKLRLDDSLRHWRSAQYNRYSGALSPDEERDNAIESAVSRLLRSHGVSINATLSLEYLSSETLDGITAIEMGTLLRKSTELVESSPNMFKLKDMPRDEHAEGSFRPLPISSGTQLQALLEGSPTLGASIRTRLFKELGGLTLLASFETRQNAREALDETSIVAWKRCCLGGDGQSELSTIGLSAQKP